MFEKKYLFFILFLFLAIFSLVKIISGVFAFAVLFLVFFYQVRVLRNELKIRGYEIFSQNCEILLLAYYIVSLSSVYYIFGILPITLLVWIILNFTLLSFFTKLEFKIDVFSVKNFFSRKIFKMSYLLNVFFILASGLLLVYFFLYPEIHGNPSPWNSVNLAVFLVFFAISFYLLLNTVNKKRNLSLSFLFLVLVVGVIAIKYIFSYGYDTLIHQSSLKHILENGQILPLTPFYVGSYALELLIHHFSSFSFNLIERWFVPLAFIFLTLVSGKYFLKRISKESYFNILPLALLFLLPNQFFFSTPYSFSLIWLIVAVQYIYLYVVYNKNEDLYLASLASLVTLFIHPFVGLSISVWVAYLYARKYFNIKKYVLLSLSMIFSSLIVILAFVVYGILTKSNFLFLNPLEYLDNFLNIFKDPVWYNRGYAAFPMWLMYFYEKSHLILISFLMLFFFIRRKKIGIFKVNIYVLFSLLLWSLYLYNIMPLLFIVLVFLIFIFTINNKHGGSLLIFISTSYLLSAWLFVSGMESSELTIFDKINYSERLLQSAKWAFWPLVLIAIINILDFIKRKKGFFKIIFLVVASLGLTISWYLVYPRQDAVSRMNVNNVRAIDYSVVEKIYEAENGKEGYLVFSNMLFAGAAIQKYGFGPYYNTEDGRILYYSVPMNSELHRAYTEALARENFSKEGINEIMREVNVNRAYFITTDYWNLHSNARKQAEILATDYWYFDNQVFVYIFDLE